MEGRVSEAIRAVGSAHTQGQLADRLLQVTQRLFGVQAVGFYLLDDRFRPVNILLRGLPDRFVEDYESLGRTVDPVLRYILENHTAAHDSLVLTDQAWHNAPLYQHVSHRYGLERIMTGPIVGQGRLVGTLNIARNDETSPFRPHELMVLSALCAHTSARLGSLSDDEAGRLPLTARQRQVAELVARGYTNAAIARELWISENSVKMSLRRIFRALSISHRAELAAILSRSNVQGRDLSQDR
ncbi:MAG: helix-turn-helix transcriptional regulator [Pseudonocardiaceae bacterium]